MDDNGYDVDDNGYDVRDYYKVSKDYGTIEDVENMLKEAHKRNIKVMFDLVMNHTSDENNWFIQSENKENGYEDFYIWEKPFFNRRGKMMPPTNWESIFGGSAWKYSHKRKEYYLKLFSDKMPDLNWKNPKVYGELSKMVNWWIDKGVDGFRIDAIAHIGKAPYRDVILKRNSYKKFSNLDLPHQILNKFNVEIFADKQIAAIGEIGGQPSFETMLSYTLPKNKELNMIFTFNHVYCNNAIKAKNENELKTDIRKLKKVLLENEKMIDQGGWLGIYWTNHDHPRFASLYGDKQYKLESITSYACAMYFLRGTPFIYNGEEIGMSNYPFKDETDFNDVNARTLLRVSKDTEKTLNYLRLTSRDNARTLMQWNSKKYAGFSDAKPWFKLNPNYKDINVADQIEDNNSWLNHYKKIISLRREYQDLLVYGSFKEVKINKNVFSYIRETDNNVRLQVIANLSNNEIRCVLSGYNKVLYSNYEELKDGKLRPYESLVLKL